VCKEAGGSEVQMSDCDVAVPEAPPEVTFDTKPLCLALKTRDHHGREVQFGIKKGSHLGKFMKAYCSRGPGQGLQVFQVRFMVNGVRIAEDDTAEKLGLVDGDVIEVSLIEEVT
jgi:hypothetical protein